MTLCPRCNGPAVAAGPYDPEGVWCPGCGTCEPPINPEHKAALLAEAPAINASQRRQTAKESRMKVSPIISAQADVAAAEDSLGVLLSSDRRNAIEAEIASRRQMLRDGHGDPVEIGAELATWTAIGESLPRPAPDVVESARHRVRASVAGLRKAVLSEHQERTAPAWQRFDAALLEAGKALGSIGDSRHQLVTDIHGFADEPLDAVRFAVAEVLKLRGLEPSTLLGPAERKAEIAARESMLGAKQRGAARDEAMRPAPDARQVDTDIRRGIQALRALKESLLEQLADTERAIKQRPSPRLDAHAANLRNQVAQLNRSIAHRDEGLKANGDLLALQRKERETRDRQHVDQMNRQRREAGMKVS